MNTKRIAASTLAATIVFLICGFLIFGLLLAHDYAPFTGVYRSPEAMRANAPIGLASSIIAMMLMSIIYAKGYEGGSGLVEGLRFGALIGVFLACKCVADEYVTLNIGGKLALEMAAGVAVEMMVVGMVIGMIYKPEARAGIV